MHFDTLTLEVAHEIMPTTDFHQKFPFNWIFQINFCVRVPLYQKQFS